VTPPADVWQYLVDIIKQTRDFLEEEDALAKSAEI